MKRPFRYWVLQHLANPVNRALILRGKLPAEMAVLESRGRRTGRPRQTPVAVLDEGGARWVVGIYGQTGWVSNLRVNPDAHLLRAGKDERVRLSEVGSGEHPEVMERLWTGAPAASRFFAGPFISARDGDPRDEWRDEAVRHPIFRVDPA